MWDLTKAHGEPHLVPQTVIPYSGRSLSLTNPTLLFSPNGKRLILRTILRTVRDPLPTGSTKCWETESGQLILDSASDADGDIVGWLPDGPHVVRLLDPTRDERNSARLAIQNVDTGRMKEILLDRTTQAKPYLSGDRIYVADGRAKLMQRFGPQLQWESSYLFDSDGQQSSMLELQADGELRGDSSASPPMAVILTQDGQRTLSLQYFNAIESAAASPGDGASRDVPTHDANNSADTPPEPPEWLGDVEQSLGLEPGQPLSPQALVRKPQPIDGVITWTYESVGHRGAVNAAAFSPDGKTIAGNPILKGSVTDLGELLGWISPTQLTLTIRARDDRPARIATLDVTNGSLQETKFYRRATGSYTLASYLRDGHIHVNHSNALQTYDGNLQLVWTQVFDKKESAADSFDLELTEVFADGRPPRQAATLAIVLTEEGQQTMRHEQFIEQYQAE